MEIKVNLHGIDAVKAAIAQTEEKLYALRTAVTDIDRAVRDIGIEIDQPPAGADG